MNHFSVAMASLHPQQAIWAKCFHPSGSFVEFRKEEVEQSIPSRFEQIVAKYPDRIAVKTRNQSLTYDALNTMANRVAQSLLAQRGEGEEPIALVIENDAPIIAAILGVLKTGKLYVPLDPLYPRARIADILEDSLARAVVTNTRNLTLARDLAHNGLQVINVDKIDSNLSPNPNLNISPDSPANILYTSGSTGQPKGVVQNHRNVLHEIMNYTNGVHICANDRLVLLSSPSFADAVRTTYGSLLNGASLYPLDIREEGLAHLADWMIQQGITIYRSVPAVFRHFVSTLTANEKFPDLRLIYSAGDSVSKVDVELYKTYFPPNCIFVNGLGSTESLTFRWYFIDKNTQIPCSTVPVGYAVEDMEVFLLDNNGKDPGLDEVGEIAVKSRYLSPGYWRKPELTRGVFSADLAGGGEQIYRTGDLGRMLSDGCLEHLGRKDFQVKIRGNRIEVSEIEIALLDVDTIKEAVVVARKDDSGDQRLVAYVVPHKRPGPTVNSLRHALRGTLPEYMIPSAFVLLDVLPLTANRKVDRRALPAPTPARPELDTPFVTARTPIEETLAVIWAEVLSLDQVGIHDNFFDLGGHSLLATQVISQVREAFHIEFPLRALFEKPTIDELAKVIIELEAQKIEAEELGHILADIQSLSDEEVQERVARGNIGSTQSPEAADNSLRPKNLLERPDRGRSIMEREQ